MTNDMVQQAVRRRSRHLKPQATVALLRDRIIEGKYEVGDWLPAERELTQELAVHRSVVRLAIAQLEKEGLVVRRPNCRPIVQAGRSNEPTESDALFAASRLVALVMYHGGELERGNSAQQRIFWGMNQALGRAGYHGLFLDLGDSIGTPEQNAAAEAAHLQYVIDQGFGGVVFYAYAYYNNRELIREVSKRLPLVLIDRTLPGVDTDFVGVQNYRAMFDATKYLVGLGHSRIAYVTRPEPINPVQDRLRGYLGAMQEAAHHNDYYEMVLSSPAVGTKWPALDAVFGQDSNKRPTAAVCVNDYEAVRFAERLTAIGLRIPDDISIVGYDNIVEKLPGGAGLTTIAQPFEEIGREAIRLFLRRIDNMDSASTYVELPSQLIVRESAIALHPAKA